MKKFSAAFIDGEGVTKVKDHKNLNEAMRFCVKRFGTGLLDDFSLHFVRSSELLVVWNLRNQRGVLVGTITEWMM